MNKSEQVAFNICTMENHCFQGEKAWSCMPWSQLGLKPAQSQCPEEPQSPETPAEVPAGPVKDSLGCLVSLESEWITARIQGDLGAEGQTCKRFCLLFFQWCMQSLHCPAMPLLSASYKLLQRPQRCVFHLGGTAHSFACELLPAPVALKLLVAL